MDSLFPDIQRTPKPLPPNAPLAERMRPQVLDELVGQEHLLGEGAPLRKLIEKGAVPSMILWGPAGTGKTTLAKVISHTVNGTIESLSAVESGVKELRDVLQRASKHQSGKPFILFIDEIHRFNKSQQDALLHAVERGVITLIGATTENPSFEVNNALLSRCHVYKLSYLSATDIQKIVERALEQQAEFNNVKIEDWPTLVQLSGGDGRSALNVLETASQLANTEADGSRHLSREVLQKAVQKKVANYDAKGDAHYDTISAFIKSMRGSDPDAACLYLAAMIDAGEDPLFIARRCIIFASEDIGNANPHALPLAVAAFQAIERIGMPEGRITLAQCVTFLSSCEKSNASYMAIETSMQLVQNNGVLHVPPHITKVDAKAYKYPHNYPKHFVDQEYFPLNIEVQKIYAPDGQGAEAEIKQRLEERWPERG